MTKFEDVHEKVEQVKRASTVPIQHEERVDPRDITKNTSRAVQKQSALTVKPRSRTPDRVTLTREEVQQLVRLMHEMHIHIQDFRSVIGASKFPNRAFFEVSSGANCSDFYTLPQEVFQQMVLYYREHMCMCAEIVDKDAESLYREVVEWAKKK
ncbi:hypothetical protein COW46_01710 [Candidatus Gracilibacteria bacterium CG17_big_fil_post_rev_8_21_14_2_50_48_13]|nr:MAG: hypothetical protein COW46_01710 [Candidatus Gracilibacteria bacterium CG17_big_fil_post_rev_8_21_14_2_50_48_13]